MQAVLATVIVHALDAVRATLVQVREFAVGVVAIADCKPKVAVPAAPAAHVRLIVCCGAPGWILKLGGDSVGVASAPVPVTFIDALMI